MKEALSPKAQGFRREVKLRREKTVPKKQAKAFFNGYSLRIFKK